jgi:hypothetical protein
MKSNPPGKGMAYVSTSVPVEVLEEIERRAEALGIKKGAFLRHIIGRWYEEGAPPLTAADDAMRRVAEEGGGYTGGRRTPGASDKGRDKDTPEDGPES